MKINLDDAILNSMSEIMGSEEHKRIFSPMNKTAQQQPAKPTEWKPLQQGGGVYRDLTQEEHKQIANTPGQVPTAPTPTVDSIKSVLQNVVENSVDPTQSAAAQGVLSGNVAPGSGKALVNYFRGQTPEQLEQLFKQVKPTAQKTASVSGIIPAIVKIADALGAMGYSNSEIVADKLIQTITVEAKAKVNAKNKEKEKKELVGKCGKCGGKCGSNGRCGKCGGKCSAVKPSKKTY